MKEHILLSRRSLCFSGARLTVKLGKCQPGRVLILKVRNSHINPESKGNYHALAGFPN